MPGKEKHDRHILPLCIPTVWLTRRVFRYSGMCLEGGGLCAFFNWRSSVCGKVKKKGFFCLWTSKKGLNIRGERGLNSNGGKRQQSERNSQKNGIGSFRPFFSWNRCEKRFQYLPCWLGHPRNPFSAMW